MHNHVVRKTFVVGGNIFFFFFWYYLQELANGAGYLIYDQFILFLVVFSTVNILKTWLFSKERSNRRHRFIFFFTFETDN